MFEISKRFHFSASHQIDSLPEGHKCARLHGHNYEVELILSAESLDEHGFVKDYGELSIFGDYISNELDHRHLNDLLVMTSAEFIARHLFMMAANLRLNPTAVRVSETGKTWASFRLSQ